MGTVSVLSTWVSHLLGGSTVRASLRTGGADSPMCCPRMQHRGELTDQSRKACLVEGLVRDQERTSIFRHVNLMLSMKGNENEFHVPGLCSAVPSPNSGSLNLTNSLMGLLLLPLKTFDSSSTKNRPRFVKRNQGLFLGGEKVFFLEIFFQVICILLLHCWGPSLKSDLWAKPGSSLQCFFLFLFYPTLCHGTAPQWAPLIKKCFLRPLLLQANPREWDSTLTSRYWSDGKYKPLMESCRVGTDCPIFLERWRRACH